MANSLYGMFGGAPQPSPFNNMQNLMQQFNQFRQTFRGDARQQIQQLLNSGRMSQQQYNQLQQTAQQFMSMFGR